MIPAPLNAPDWLIARPIAHRGLHDKTNGCVENSLAAAQSAIAHHYAIECDVQISKDGEAIVFHDFTLDRLTDAHGAVDELTAKDLVKISYKDGLGTLPTLAAFLSTVAERVPLMVEIKSGFDGDLRLAERVAALIAGYPGPVAVKSFDPNILRVFRRTLSPCPIGVLGEADYNHEEWAGLSASTKAALTDFSFFAELRPDFLSWAAHDLPHAVPNLCREGIGMPVIAWTLRSTEERTRISAWADQIVFEGFMA